MKLTKRKALEITVAWWDWLYQHPMKSKKEWPEFAPYGEFWNWCACCEWMVQHGHVSEWFSVTCTYCPIPAKEWGTPTCGDKGGLYTKWALAQTPRTRKKYSKAIRDAAQRSLDKLKGAK